MLQTVSFTSSSQTIDFTTIPREVRVTIWTFLSYTDLIHVFSVAKAFETDLRELSRLMGIADHDTLSRSELKKALHNAHLMNKLYMRTFKFTLSDSLYGRQEGVKYYSSITGAEDKLKRFTETHQITITSTKQKTHLLAYYSLFEEVLDQKIVTSASFPLLIEDDDAFREVQKFDGDFEKLVHSFLPNTNEVPKVFLQVIEIKQALGIDIATAEELCKKVPTLLISDTNLQAIGNLFRGCPKGEMIKYISTLLSLKKSHRSLFLDQSQNLARLISAKITTFPKLFAQLNTQFISSLGTHADDLCLILTNAVTGPLDEEIVKRIIRNITSIKSLCVDYSIPFTYILNFHHNNGANLMSQAGNLVLLLKNGLLEPNDILLPPYFIWYFLHHAQAMTELMIQWEMRNVKIFQLEVKMVTYLLENKFDLIRKYPSFEAFEKDYPNLIAKKRKPKVVIDLTEAENPSPKKRKL